MDLLGDLGTQDQLTSAREENAVLQAKCKELSIKVKELTIENQSLLAEVEMYRKEAALPSFSNLALGKAASAGEGMDVDNSDGPDEFIKAGDGTFASDPAISLENLHGSSNPLCCALNPDDTLLATGGADSHLSLCAWGGALAPTPGAAQSVVSKAIRIACPAPVICTAFSQKELPIVAAGCMDGTVKLMGYTNIAVAGLQAQLLSPSLEIKHTKYTKAMAWCPTAPILATASADGTVVLSKVTDLQESGAVAVEKMETLYMNGTVETLAFTNDGRHLCCYTRETPHLSFFDLQNDCKQTKLNLNSGGGAAAGGFDEHVSFAVMDMCFSPNGNKFLALATDSSRNIVIDATSGKHIRNLYGHTNDGYSQPKIAWSRNGQYIYGNTQEDGSVCVWDVASSTIVKRLDQASGGHSSPVRCIFSSKLTDTVVTSAFDKSTKLWLTPM